jgi:hypothetical protein
MHGLCATHSVCIYWVTLIISHTWTVSSPLCNFLNPRLLHLSSIHTFSSIPYSQTLSVYVLPLMWQNEWHFHSVSWKLPAAKMFPRPLHRAPGKQLQLLHPDFRTHIFHVSKIWTFIEENYIKKKQDDIILLSRQIADFVSTSASVIFS